MNGMPDNATVQTPRGDYHPEPLKEPKVFLRRLTCTAAVSAAIVLTLTGVGVWSVVSHYVTRFAENSSVNISTALSWTERDSFFTETPERERRVVAEIPPDRLVRVHGQIRRFLKSFDIAKIKVYNREARIIYSTDRAIIGETDIDNRRLRSALSGRNDAKLVRKGGIPDLANESRLDADVVETYVPIYDDDGEVIGCFEVYIDVSRYRAEIHQIVTIALIVISMIMLVVYGIAFKFVRRGTWKLKEAQDMLELYAASDPLTGVYNRRHLLVRARQELVRLQREKVHNGGHGGMSVTMLDLDHFKTVNDTYGHIVGDEVLKETARRIVSMTRVYDLVGRMGGEEFVIVHPDADYLHAKGIADRIWGAIRAEPYIIKGNHINVTASLGVATLDPAEARDFTSVLGRADRALYDAKNTGRDRVV
jgi:diguanylate cyclase (GGDEF)-like protein